MARKTALNKQPNVSIALPDYEKRRLNANKPGGNPPLQRLSPGVYRNPSGQLVNSGGRPLQRQQPQQNGATVGQSIANSLQPQGPQTRLPAPMQAPMPSQWPGYFPQGQEFGPKPYPVPWSPQQQSGFQPFNPQMMQEANQMQQAEIQRMYNAMMQRQPQPNTVSGMLQNGAQQPNSGMPEMPQQMPWQNQPYPLYNKG